MTLVTLTSSALNAAIWGGDVTRLLPRDGLAEPDGRGWYVHAGTRLPVRRLEGVEHVKVGLQDGRLISVADNEGGWIAARFPSDGREVSF
jgi:hypothetical protein